MSGWQRSLVMMAAVMAAAGGSASGFPSTMASNLLSNGSFGDTTPSLAGWRADFTADGNKWYMGNHKLVSIVDRDHGKRHVLRIHVATTFLADNPGVKVDSMPIPYERGARYRLTMSGRTTGPNARVLIEGYQWRPGVKPHPHPEFHSLRKVYRQGAGRMLYFKDETQGAFSGPARTWKVGQCVFPGDDLSSQAKAHLRRVRFLAIHIVGIGGGVGELFIDDVRLEKIAAPGGAQ
jgi:hypothetical protein